MCPDHPPPMKWHGILLGIAVTLAFVWLFLMLASNLPAGTLPRVMVKLGLVYGRVPVDPNRWGE